MKNLTKQQLIHRQEPGKRWIRRESGYATIAPGRVTNMNESSSINSCCRKGLKKLVKIFSCLCVQQCLAFNLLSSVFCVRFIFWKVAMSIVATPITFNDVLTLCLRFFEICFELGCRRQCDGTVTVCRLPSLMGELQGNSWEWSRIHGLA